MKLHETTATLRRDLVQDTAESEAQIATMKKQKEVVTGNFQEMKSKMGSTNADQRKKLTKMSVHGKQVLKKVEAHSQSASEIMRIATACMRYETDQDRYQAHVLNGAPIETEEEAKEAFLNRLNKVKYECIQLKETEKSVLEENARLKKELKHILEGMSVSEATMQKQNPLFMINGKSGIM